VKQTEALGHTVNIRARIRSASQNKDVVMNRFLSAALLSCAAASLSNPAWSFEGFGLFEKMLETIECVRKPGTDYLICGPKTQDEEEQEAEEVVPEPVANPDLLPTEIHDGVLATDPNMDFVWAETKQFIIDMGPLEAKLQFGDSCDEVFQQIFPESINDDEYQDFMIQIECMIDELYQGKSMMNYWQADYIAESFIVFACGSEQGLYNCTEEFTGHSDVLAMAPAEWPGAFVYNQPAFLYDVNDDGVKDIFMWTFKDTDDRADYSKYDFTEPVFDRYYDLWGKPYEACEFREETPQTGYTCWFQRAVQTFALSTPDGHVVKELKWPGKFDTPHDYWIWHTDDGEVHLMFDKFMQGQELWFTWNSQTEDFDYVSSKTDVSKPPLEYKEDWNSADVITGNRALHHPWITHNGVQYKVAETDYSRILTLDGNAYEYCIREDVTDFDYDICQRDQIYVLAKTDSGIESIIEYRPLEIASEARNTSMFYGGFAGPDEFHEDYVSILIHGYWLTYDLKRSVTGKLVQLEDRPDADWYLIVTYMGQADLLAPGESHVEEAISESSLECSTGYECLYAEANMTFKYRVDFDNQELIYEGTLTEYPFIWRSSSASDFKFEDHNNDGWKDLAIKHESFDIWHVSNEYGELNFVDLQTILPEGRRKTPSDTWMDFDNDGKVDYIKLIEQRDNNKTSESIINVDFTAENLWEATPILDAWELEDRIDNCLREDEDGTLYLQGRASQCYSTRPDHFR